MNRFISTAAVVVTVVASLAGSGCYTVNADLPGTLRADLSDADMERVSVASVEKGQWFFLWGLVGETPRDFVSAELAKQVQSKGADGIANLTWKSEFGCTDLLFAGCTGGCVTPRTYKVTGDIVRLKKAPLAGRPAKAAALPVPGPVVVDAQRF